MYAHAPSLPTPAPARQDPGDLSSDSAKPLRARSDGFVGRSHVQDMFVLRGSAAALARYNAAQPLHVIAGVSDVSGAPSPGRA
jgi:hypothetical protein